MEAHQDQQAESPQWCPIDRLERRVLGVLIEKSKTTPNQYPLTLNAITTGCNQKSNRKPIMQVDRDDVQLVLDKLRSLGAVVEILGDGRVAKYKHLGYKWMGVDKAELAVMAELLLRGEQTLGDLRARVARMHPLKDLSELAPIVDALIEKQLVVSLTPAGRGQIVTHNLYLSQQLDKLKRQVGTGGSHDGVPAAPPAESSSNSGSVGVESQSNLVERIEVLEDEVQQLRSRLDAMEALLE